MSATSGSVSSDGQRGDGEVRQEGPAGQEAADDLAAQERARQLLTEQRGQRAQGQWLNTVAVAVVLVIVAVAALTITKYSAGDSGTSTSTATSAAPAGGGSAGTGDAGATRDPGAASTGDAAAVVAAATGVPAEVLDAVGRGQVMSQPQPVSGQPALTEAGKPLVVYIGAEYCPFCASQRWAVAVALSRFGTFSGLGTTHSASDDAYPNTQTLTFHGATYTSDYLAFQGVETASNVRQDGRYAPLDALTAQQEQLMSTLNAPPYVAQDSAGAIPFLDLGNQYVLVGGSYDVSLLQGRSAQQIADALGDPGDPIAQGVHGTANMLTTLLCRLTGGQPAQVCTSAAATAYEGAL